MDFGKETKTSMDDAICTLGATQYLVDGSLGASHESMVTARLAFDSGAGLHISRRSALAPNWESQVDEKAVPPRLSDSNGSPLDPCESVCLTARFSNTLYRDNFIIAERLTADFITGTAFLNRYVVTILCTEQRILFRRGETPIGQKRIARSQG